MPKTLKRMYVTREAIQAELKKGKKKQCFEKRSEFTAIPGKEIEAMSPAKLNSARKPYPQIRQF